MFAEYISCYTVVTEIKRSYMQKTKVSSLIWQPGDQKLHLFHFDVRQRNRKCYPSLSHILYSVNVVWKHGRNDCDNTTGKCCDNCSLLTLSPESIVSAIIHCPCRQQLSRGLTSCSILVSTVTAHTRALPIKGEMRPTCCCRRKNCAHQPENVLFRLRRTRQRW